MCLNCFITLHVLIPGIRRVKCSHLYFCLLHGRFPAWGCHGFHPLHHLKVPLAWDNLQPVIKKAIVLSHYHWRIQGRGQGGLFLDQTEAQRAPPQNFMRPPPPPPPPPPSPYLTVWMTAPLISRSGSGNDYYHFQSGAKGKRKTPFFIFSCEFYLHFYLQLHDVGTIQSQVI